RHRQPEQRHLGEVRALAAEERLHVLVSLGLSVAEEVDALALLGSARGGFHHFPMCSWILSMKRMFFALPGGTRRTCQSSVISTRWMFEAFSFPTAAGERFWIDVRSKSDGSPRCPFAMRTRTVLSTGPSIV